MVHHHNIKKPVALANNNDRMITLPEYEPNLGAPFKVVLFDSVEQEISEDGEVLETVIPNLDGLLKEVAFARSLDPRKFSPADIKFVRAAVGLKAVDLADLLGVTPEHISRCEKGDRVLSVAAEKLFRVIVLKRRHNPAELANCFSSILENEDLSNERKRGIFSLVEKYKKTIEEIETAIFDFRIQTAYAIEDLIFEFELVRPDEDELTLFDDKPEDKWRTSEKVAA